MAHIHITDTLSIPEGEVDLSFTRSGGPGGQHANTSDTKVVLRFDVAGSPSLSDAQRTRLMKTLDSRLTDDGELILSANEHRSQTRNREAVLGRFQTIVAQGLRPPKRRRKTKVPRAAKRRRLEAKRRRAEKKKLRRPPEIP